ncbi:hypothetical protein BBJ28_00013308 [Nothophytophthora sp. Chile5]|nr:hypothetical protein BBJ28_00013308 [Nothophytophthora sp. Chile5]
MYVAGDPRGYRTAVVTHVDDPPDEADAPIKISTQEMIPSTMMIKKVFNRDGEEVKCYWRKLRTYELVSGEFQAPSDRTRFAESVQNINSAVFTGPSDTDPAIEAEVGPRTTHRTTDDDQAPSMTSSASTTAAVAVARGHTDAHESEEEDAYEEKAPVPTATTKTKGKTKAKKTANGKRASTPRGRSAAPAAPPKARATLAQGHPSEETSQRAARKPPAKKAKRSVSVKAKKTSSSRLNCQLSSAPPTHGANPPGHGARAGSRKTYCPHDSDYSDSSSGPDLEIGSEGDDASGDLYRLNTLALVSMNTRSFYKKKASGVNSAVKRVGDGGGEVDVEDAHLQSEEKTDDNEPDQPEQPDYQEEEASQPAPSQLADLRDILVVPTLAQREAQYHRRKESKVDYHVGKSRKKRYQNRRAPTRSGSNIYHSHTLTAKKMRDLLRIPGMRAKLANVRKKKPVYIPPSQPDPNDAETDVMESIPFPDYVTEILENIVPEGLKFLDACDVDPCLCVGNCFADLFRNADTAFYCTPVICRLDALCSNAPRTHPGLRIYDTQRLDLGVYTTQKLWAGESVAEYCGNLQEYEAMRTGQPEEAMKQNSGYAMLLNEKTRRGNFVYVEALAAGSIARFFQHACSPNVQFVEMENWTQVKVLCRMVRTVDIGAQITVSYGNEIWFKCACDPCWKEHLSQK